MYLEQHYGDDTLIPLAKHPRLRVHWVARRDEKSLAEAIESLDWSNWYVWATPEAATLKHVRKRLRDEFGFPKSAVHAQAYWSAGRAMGTRRGDEPDDATASVPDDVQAEGFAAPGRGRPLRRIVAAAARGRRTADPR
jgi:ATP-binding cassette subfamily B protein IrtA